jgi:hypothetical protein
MRESARTEFSGTTGGRHDYIGYFIPAMVRREEPVGGMLERFFRSLCPLAGGATVALLSTVALGGSPIERFYVFGDSYSDGGNGYFMIQRPPTPPYEARYANGPTAVEHLAKAFATPLRNSNEGAVR